ncbi:MAG: hypothetical protein LBS27_10150 [Bifidobacteriaceae bacterium]|nr:hypothetical protein [Bifidobacteriaceae bacterium]
MRRALFEELKNSPFLVAGPLLALAQIALMLSNMAAWRGAGLDRRPLSVVGGRVRG